MTLSSFYSYLDKKELLVDEIGLPVRNPMLGIDSITVPRKPIRWLREADDEALLSVDMNDQERIVMQFLRWAGVRVDEATSVLQGHIDFTAEDEGVWIDDSKTPNGRRGVPLSSPS